jgi:hypothetical protein
MAPEGHLRQYVLTRQPAQQTELEVLPQQVRSASRPWSDPTCPTITVIIGCRFHHYTIGIGERSHVAGMPATSASAFLLASTESDTPQSRVSARPHRKPSLTESPAGQPAYSAPPMPGRIFRGGCGPEAKNAAWTCATRARWWACSLGLDAVTATTARASRARLWPVQTSRAHCAHAAHPPVKFSNRELPSGATVTILKSRSVSTTESGSGAEQKSQYR